MSLYLGMRWFKCDLHLHTPEDNKNWRDDETKLGNPRRSRINGNMDEKNIQEKARKYLHCCHDLGLHIIGVTEHNFSQKTDPRDWFLLHMVEQNKPVAKDRDVDPLTILPGFEVDIGYHAVCLFPPATSQDDLESCNRILTKLGLPENERFVDGAPAQLRHNDQKLSLKKLLEIVQEEHQGIVIAAHADRDGGLLADSGNKEDYANPDLYCVELTQSPPAGRFSNILSGRNQNWERKSFHPAWIMSSDAKSLARNGQGQCPANSLGYRHTWIKMSKPSIEALRQAFLDPISRIRQMGDNPSSQEKHARIVSVSISNAAFLHNQSFEFSPNLNCIIGGRGSGKSAILEGMRLAMGKDDDPKLDERTREKVNRIRDLLAKKPGTEVRVHWQNADSVEDTLVYSVSQTGSATRRIDGREMPDLSSFLKDLPLQFFSQQQLNQITAPGGNVLLALLDEFAREELKPLYQRESELRREIEQVFASTATLEQIEKDLNRIQQESAELERQWQARASLQDDARRHQGLKSEQAYLAKLKTSIEDDGARLVAVVDDMCETHSPLGSTVDRWPHGLWFKGKDEQILQAKDVLKSAVGSAFESYRKMVSEMFEWDPAWQEIKQQLDQADAAFTQVCSEKGIAPEDVSRIQEIGQKRLVKKQELDQKTKERIRLQAVQQQLPGLFQALHENWRACHKVREQVGQQVTQAATIDDKPVIRLMVSCFAEETDFNNVWKKLSTDGRTRLGRNWEEIGKVIRSVCFNDRIVSSIWEMLQSWMDNESEIPAEIKTQFKKLQIEFSDIKIFLEEQSRKIWQDVRVTRIKDNVDLVLYRSDGEEVGRVSDGKLSDGQRNTAALAMLLARGSHPLVIDQPEDELDSHFIFRELVPMLRRLKTSRQIILVTHNANLPVNGDAELVYALETRDGRGIRLAEGGLDQSKVTEAVLEIMEGSEEAFRKRKEKYNF